MKKILLSLLAVMISFTALAQTDGDKITINNSEGKQAEWNLTGETNTISSMKHNASNQLEIYLKGRKTSVLSKPTTSTRLTMSSSLSITKAK